MEDEEEEKEYSSEKSRTNKYTGFTRETLGIHMP